jgi:hypothetical protein
VITECNPLGRTTIHANPDATTSAGNSDDSGSVLAWVIPVAILGGAALAVGIRASVLRHSVSDQDGLAGAPEASSFANPLFETGSGAGDPTHDAVGGGGAGAYATVQGFVRQGSGTSVTHVQVGANDLYAGIPAEATYSELTPFGQGDTTYMDVAAVPAESAYTDVAPHGFGFDGEETV